MRDSRDVETAAIIRLLRESAAELVNVGHGRDAVSIACAQAFVDSWNEESGDIGAVVGWPGQAASWLRPARRLAAGPPDAWVIADTVTGWVPISRRLLGDTGWGPGRTVAFSSLHTPTLVASAGYDATEGMRGVTRAGGGWTVVDGTFREW